MRILDKRYNCGRKLGEALTQEKVDNATHLLIDGDVIIGTANYIKRPTPHAMYEVEEALQNEAFLDETSEEPNGV